MRICLVYDCLFPHTVGGAERWYRNLALRLAADDHEVTYVTMRQWERGEVPDLPGVRVVVAGPRMGLYGSGGQRRTLPPILFGAGVSAHLLRSGRRYDVVHTCSFPYFPLLGAAALRRIYGYRLVVDWFELWSREYWRDYLGGAAGRVGEAVQLLCLRVRQHAFCYAELTAARLRIAGLNGGVRVLRGLYGGPVSPPAPLPAEPLVVFAGRMIPEKRAPALVPAIARARERVPGLRGAIFGDGPDRPTVRAAIADHGLEAAIDAPGFVPIERVEHALAHALCLVLPSRREGYGLVVVEAASVGTPVVLVRGQDNAATELVEAGVNGFVSESADPAALADAITAVHEAGAALRTSTAEWFTRHAHELSLDASLDVVSATYRESARS